MADYDKKKVVKTSGVLAIIVGLGTVIGWLMSLLADYYQAKEGFEKSKNSETTTSIVETVEKSTKANETKESDVIEVSAVEQAEPETVSPTEPPTEPQPTAVYLDSLKLAESDNFHEDETIAEDTIGNTYTVHLLTIGGGNCGGGDEDYAMYYLGGKYKTLSGTIAVHDDTLDNVSAEVSILCDENVVYTTSAVSRATAPIEFSLDVGNCQWLKIFKITYGDKYICQENKFILHNWKLE